MKESVYIVVSNFNKNVDWVQRFQDADKILIYEKEKPNYEYNIPVNKGNEASTYLKYIIDHYDNLPDYTFFVHDTEYAWHHTGSLIDRFEEAKKQDMLYYNINNNILGDITTNEYYNHILKWYDIYIEPYIPHNKLPDKNWTQGYKGSAQFLVHKSLITNLPKKFYEDLYNWIIKTDIPSSISGRFFEWSWHIFWDIYPKHIMNN